MQKRTQQLLLMLVIGILLGTTAVMGWNAREVGRNQPAGNSTPSGATTTDLEVGATSTTSLLRTQNLPSAPAIPANLRVGINVQDQPAGAAVFVAGLALTENHWIAVYDDQDGRPGSILGASRVRTGYISTSVDLLRNTEVGNKYYAAILNDNGDDVFNRQSDLPPFAPERVIIVSFYAR